MNFALNVIGKPGMILLAATVLAMLLRRSSASVRHAVWVLGLTAAAVLPFVPMIVPQIELPLLSHATTSVTFLQGPPKTEESLPASNSALPDKLWDTSVSS